jgi:hypothetical protein
VATDAAGDLYVADTFNQRIQKFDNLEPSPPTGTSTGSQGGTTTTQGTASPQCQVLRKKLKAAKKAGNKAKVKKIRRKLRRLGC